MGNSDYRDWFSHFNASDFHSPCYGLYDFLHICPFLRPSLWIHGASLIWPSSLFGNRRICFWAFHKILPNQCLSRYSLGGAGSGLMGMLLGLIMVRATGACFSLMALAFNHIGFFLVLSPLKHITNGEDGFGAHAQSIGFLNFNNKVTMFISTLLLLLLVFYILKRLTTSPYGILVRSIKEDENRVRFLDITRTFTNG